jgi:AcrR family transcriptional regulator
MGIRERKEREKEARREEIIDAAEKVFFEKGVAVSTMDEVAQAAELSKGTLYLYYKSKEDLVLAVVLRGMDIMYEMFQKVVSTGEPTITRIKNLGDAYYDFFRKHRNHFRTFYFFENPQLQSQVSVEMRDLCAASDKKVWKLVIELIQDGIDEGMLHKGLNPMEAAVMLWSNSNGLMRLIDRTNEYWTSQMGIDLVTVLRRSNAFLVEGMMSEKGKKQFGAMLEYHEEHKNDK